MTDVKFDADKFEQLLGQNNLDGARELIDAFLEDGGDDSDVARALFGLEMAKMKVQNEIDEAYLEGLMEVRDQLRAISESEKKTAEKMKLAKTRASLS